MSLERVVRAVLALLLFCLTATLACAVALPGPTTCLLVGAMDLHRLPDGSLTDSLISEDKQRFSELTLAARARIESKFGPVESNPVLVFFSNPKGLGPFRLNSYGSTQFIGPRACVMIGPNGQNIDVVTHELMHGETGHRVGWLKRWLHLPVWVDEGISMQVDYRSRYELPVEDIPNAGDVRKLNTVSEFFSGDEKTVVSNYARSKYVVASWLTRIGEKSLYQRLERMKNGESFEEALGMTELPARTGQ
jgi:hypothetical protein